MIHDKQQQFANRVNALADKNIREMKKQLSRKQEIYKQMLHDDITGPVQDKVVEDIATLNRKIHGQA